jgi:putative flippase GtrA
MEPGRRQGRAGPGALTAFARFVVCGGGVGIASSFAVTAAASVMPWILANALITAASTLLATELHARFTFGAGRHASRRQHAQSAGSAVGAYAVTSAAMLALHLLTTPGAMLEQAVYLSASALAGVARFAVLRLVVFARRQAQPEKQRARGERQRMRTEQQRVLTEHQRASAARRRTQTAPAALAALPCPPLIPGTTGIGPAALCRTA